jgi:copper(I)-binding protein
MKRILLQSALALSVISASVLAQQTNGASVAVEHAWARASTGTSGAAYLSVWNYGTAPDRLLSVRTPVAKRAAIHQSKMENGVMEMRPGSPLRIRGEIIESG